MLEDAAVQWGRHLQKQLDVLGEIVVGIPELLDLLHRVGVDQRPLGHARLGAGADYAGGKHMFTVLFHRP